jgi:hypothetical protein
VVTNLPEWNAILAASDAAAGRTWIAVMMIYRSDPDAEKSNFDHDVVANHPRR